MITRDNLRQVIVPAYLFLCILLGGSAQAIWGKLLLEVIALVLFGWAAIRSRAQPLSAAARTLLGIALAAVIIIALQLVPLPPSVWAHLPGRHILVEGYLSLGEPLPWLPLSMTPADTLSSALYLLAPVSVIVAMHRLDACRDRWAIVAVIAATILSVALGYIQVSTKSPHWYLYEATNFDSAVGFFANRNHMATLLLVAIPFITAILPIGREGDMRALLPMWVGGIAAAILVLAGIAMNGSLAGIALALPVIGGAVLMSAKASQRFRMIGAIAVAFAFVVSLALLANSPVQGKLTGVQTASITGRHEIWAKSISAATDAFPIGTGFGSFLHVYPLYEDPLKVTDTYVIHAHNDFIELVLEGGLASGILIAAFLIWWAAAAWRVWRDNRASLARAATVASAAILAHSIVDYPLRTTAIAAIFAFCCGVMAGDGGRGHSSQPIDESQRRANRHVTIE